MQRPNFPSLPAFSPRRGALIVGACVLAAIAYSVLRPSTYSSEVSLIGASSDVAEGSLGSLAAQFGIRGLGTSRGAVTPETFVEYMQSAVFEQAILEHPLRLSSTTVRLDSLWGDRRGVSWRRVPQSTAKSRAESSERDRPKIRNDQDYVYDRQR